MTLKELDSRLAKTEGKKKQTSVGNVREIRKCLMKIIQDEIEETGTSATLLLLLGKKKDRKKLIGVILDEF